MLRVLLLIPEGQTFDLLSEDQQAAINGVFGQYVMPMPGTTSYEGKVICDALAADAFDPSLMAPLGLDWPIISMSDDNGNIIIPLNKDEFVKRLPEPHGWAGWPSSLMAELNN